MSRLTCFGEVLWDVFPTHEMIGGAPLNVAVRLQSLSNEVSVISKIGNDQRGEEILTFLHDRDVTIEGIQQDDHYSTGYVNIVLDQKGSASYTIPYPCAWDKIQLTEKVKKIAASTEAFLFGSLVTRDEVSKQTLLALLEIATFKIFDVNLRAPFYTYELLMELMMKADFIKFNDDELLEIGTSIAPEMISLKELAKYLSKVCDAQIICVTRGEEGAFLYMNQQFYDNKGYKVEVVDTVGAGDSFLATLIDKLLKNNPPQYSLDYACAMGALVANNKGATPTINPEDINRLQENS